MQVLRQAPGKIRPVGSGHSFSALVPTDGTLLSLSHFSGLLGHDAQTLQAEFGGGTPMAQMGAPLQAVGQALVNMADIDYQTLAGAIATSTKCLLALIFSTTSASSGRLKAMMPPKAEVGSVLSAFS